MHGLILAGLRDYSVERLGEAEAAELWADRIFEPMETYDDEWFAAQLERIVGATGESRDTVEQAFGRFAARSTFVDLFPGYYADSDDVVAFLLGVEEKIHEIVRATVRGASPPRLQVQRLGDVGVLVSYTSERGLCRVLEGLVHGTAEQLGDAVHVEEIQCMRRGDPACVFTVIRSDGG